MRRRLDGIASCRSSPPTRSRPSTRCSPTSRSSATRGYAMDDEETVEGVVCFGVAIPGRRPGEGPYAASITLLKARATAERVPALVDDLHAARRPAVGSAPRRAPARPPAVAQSR